MIKKNVFVYVFVKYFWFQFSFFLLKIVAPLKKVTPSFPANPLSSWRRSILTPWYAIYVCVSWSKDFYIYGQFYADKCIIPNNDSIMMIYDLFIMYDVWFSLTVIIGHPFYWNYGHNLFLLKYFHKICTDKYLCILLHCK